MKVSINCGHTKTGKGTGAVYDGYKESEIVRLIGNEVIKLLKAKGHEVNNSTVNYSTNTNAYLREVANIANNSGSDLFLSIHCNTSSTHKGNGTECFTWKGKKTLEAIKLCYELSLLGFKNRGIKDGSKLYVVKNTKMNAILIELFFMDNKTDIDLYKKVGYKKIAQAICNAIN